MLHDPDAQASVCEQRGTAPAVAHHVAVIVISDVLLHREGVAAALTAQPGLRVLATGAAEGEAI